MQENETKISKKKVIIWAVVLVAVLVAAIFLYIHFSQGAVAGDKTITFQVVHGDESTKDFTISTDAENLGDALVQQGIISGNDSEYGLYVTTVDGETADDSLNQWWCFTKGGEMLATGVDSTMIADGEQYEATMSVY